MKGIELIIYFVALAIITAYAKKKTKNTPEDYFLASRGFGAIVLFFTLAATNFSAFSFLGFAGMAYKNGLGQYGIMALGTSFMAIMFYIIGGKVWELGKKKNYITPGELIGKENNSKFLQILFMSIMTIFTIPYLAIQAIGAGYILNSIYSIDLKLGAIIVMITICLYVIFGGMKASGWTDVLQGLIMIFAMLIAFITVVINLGGIEKASMMAYEAKPSLFSRPGPNNYYTIQIWLSFLILWIFCDPMFPQLFTRFYTAKSEKSLMASMYLYPLLISFFFLFPVLIGVWANGVNMEVSNIDSILPEMVKKFSPRPIYSFVMIGALAALMSTADSQLLALSTMLSCDIFGKKIGYSKLITILLTIFALIFVVFGYDAKVGIMGTLVKTTFSGLVVLFPATFATLYWKKVTKWGCIASILAGEAMVFLYAFYELPAFGFLPAIIALISSFKILIAISLIT